MSERISVVIPAYNAAAYLKDAVESARQQTRPVNEIIVVDDCSTDATLEVARQLGVTVMSTGTNSGPSMARNIGWRAASSQLIAFIDADDIWFPEHCEVVAGLLDANPRAELAFGQQQVFGTHTGVSQAELPDGIPSDAFLQLLRRNVVPQLAVVVRRNALAATGGYDESLRYSEDYDLWLRLAQRGPFICSHRVTAGYRRHPAQATQSVSAVVNGSWVVRHKVYKQLCTENASQDMLTLVRRQLMNAYNDDLLLAWNTLNRELLLETLGLSHLVPDGELVRLGWERRIRYWWYPWKLLKNVDQALPAYVRRLGRRVLKPAPWVPKDIRQ